MKLYDIVKAITKYENCACEDFWDDNPELCEKANKTKFFEWLKKERSNEFNLIVNKLVEYRKDGGENICTIMHSSHIEPIEQNLLQSKIELSSIFMELDLNLTDEQYNYYVDKYKELEPVIFNFEKTIKYRLVAIMFCEYLAETKNPLGKEIIDTKYDNDYDEYDGDEFVTF